MSSGICVCVTQIYAMLELRWEQLGSDKNDLEELRSKICLGSAVYLLGEIMPVLYHDVLRSFEPDRARIPRLLLHFATVALRPQAELSKFRPDSGCTRIPSKRIKAASNWRISIFQQAPGRPLMGNPALPHSVD